MSVIEKAIMENLKRRGVPADQLGEASVKAVEYLVEDACKRAAPYMWRRTQSAANVLSDFVKERDLNVDVVADPTNTGLVLELRRGGELVAGPYPAKMISDTGSRERTLNSIADIVQGFDNERS